MWTIKFKSLHCLPYNSSDRISLPPQNARTIDSDFDNISRSQEMSISQPNLALLGHRHIYCSPAYSSTRCSSINTLPPSSSRCGSPIQPTLLSPLGVSRSPTPYGSQQNLPILPLFIPVAHQDTISAGNTQNGNEMDISVQKNHSSVRIRPEN